MTEEEPNQKIQRIILDLNKNGLSYLTSGQHNEAIQFFKKAEKVTTQQLKINSQNLKINQLAGITYNNLACYYKKNNKPKVALAYLKKALQIEVYKVQDWTSTASTHLNICAIYSFLNKHHQSTEHAALALTMLDKVDTTNLKQNQAEGDKSYWNIKMLSHYNYAIELEHLKRFEQSRKQFTLAKETAENSKKKNQKIIESIQESIKRINQEEGNQKKKLIQLLNRKKQQQEKGNHEFMRKNKKNFGDQQQWRAIIQAKKYELYKNDLDPRKQYQSTDKVRKKLTPINEGNQSKRTFVAPI